MNVKRVNRSYDASGRRARAQQVRQEVVAAAAGLFQQNGFAGTTVADVAREAHVSPETIYKAFGAKSALMGAVIRATIRGDADPAPLRERSAIEGIRKETDAAKQFELYGKLLAAVNPRLAPLLGVVREAARSDPELAAALAQLNADRFEGMTEFASLLARRGSLRSGVSRRTAADVLWTLNSPEIYELLVLERGWSARRYGSWVAQQLVAALLPAPG